MPACYRGVFVRHRISWAVVAFYEMGLAMTIELSKDDRSIIEHSLGIEYKTGRKRKPYRNYYCASKGDIRLENLVNLGLMERGHEINNGRDQYYIVTAVGAAAAESKLPE